MWQAMRQLDLPEQAAEVLPEAIGIIPVLANLAVSLSPPPPL